MSYHTETNETGHRFLSTDAEQLCQKAISAATYKTSSHRSALERDIEVRNLNIRLLETHIPAMRDDRDIARAHQTIAGLHAQNKAAHAQGAL
jgi:hypothetical protein